MAVDIGPKIGIDGEKEFRQELNNLAQQMRTLGSEMKAVTSAFDANDKSQEALAAQTDVLNRQIATQQQRLTQLQRGLDAAAQKFGENDTRTLKWAQAVNNATADLNKLRTQLGRTEGEMDDVTDATDDMADAMDDAGRQSQGFGQMLAGAFTGGAISGLVQSVVDGVQQIIESTQEYRRIMASLESSSQRAGYSAAETSATYEQLYGVLGDEQTAATTTANLQALGLAQEQLTQLTDAAIGAWATYGDSIPIDGLSEAINETIRVGQVTGTFADALNWAGTSEDEFNERLAAAGSEAERANLVLQELADQGLVAAGEGWRQNNKDLVEANLAAAGFSETMAGFAEILTPIVTTAKTGLNEILQSVLGVAQAFQSGGISGGMQALGDLASEAVETIRAQAPQMLQAGYDLIGDLVDGIVSALPAVAEGIGSLLAEIYNFMAENGPGLVEQGYEIVGDLLTGIIDAIPDLVAQLPAIIKAFIGYITSVLPEVAKQGAILLGRLAIGIVQAIPDLLAELPALGIAILEGIGDALKGVVDIGRDLVEGLWQGIKDAAGWLKDKLFGWAGDILDDVKNALGIHSPSAVFANEVGRYAAQGVAVGFEREMGAVASRMQRAMPTPTIETVNNAAAGMVNGLAAVSAGGRNVFEIVFNVDGKEFFRTTLDDLRAVQKSNPEVAMA